MDQTCCNALTQRLMDVKREQTVAPSNLYNGVRLVAATLCVARICKRSEVVRYARSLLE